MRNSHAAYLLGFLLIVPFTLAAQERALTLHDCIVIALGESPKLEASRFDIRAAAEEIRAAQAMTWPKLTGTATGEMFSGESTSTFQLVNAIDSGVGLNRTSQVNLAGIGIFGARLQYPIFSDGSIFGFNDAPAIAAKRAQEDALAWTAHLTREEVIDRVTQTFLATVSARNRVPSIERRVTLLEQAVAITREELARGLLLPIDLKVVTEQLNGAQSLSKVIHQNAVAGSLEMARLLGLPSASDVRLVSTLPEPPEPPSAVQLLGASLNQHPLLEVQRANVDKAKQDYRLERFRLYPSVSLTGSAHYLSDFDHNAHVYIGAITVSVPIFDFGAQLATVRAKRAQYFAEQARLGSVADDVTNDVVKIYDQIAVLSEFILTLQGEIAKLDRDARVAASQQQQGVTPLLPSIDAEVHLLGKRDELNVLETSRLLLYAALQQATGGTWNWLP